MRPEIHVRAAISPIEIGFALPPTIDRDDRGLRRIALSSMDAIQPKIKGADEMMGSRADSMSV